MSEEIGINPYSNCPKCGSNKIDQRHYDSGFNTEFYHCSECGCWYDEFGNEDLEGIMEDEDLEKLKESEEFREAHGST